MSGVLGLQASRASLPLSRQCVGGCVLDALPGAWRGGRGGWCPTNQLPTSADRASFYTWYPRRERPRPSPWSITMTPTRRDKRLMCPKFNCQKGDPAFDRSRAHSRLHCPRHRALLPYAALWLYAHPGGNSSPRTTQGAPGAGPLFVRWRTTPNGEGRRVLSLGYPLRPEPSTGHGS